MTDSPVTRIQPILKPVAALFSAVATADRRRKLDRQYRSRFPVVSIGALSVGGAGKTPLTLHLLERFQRSIPVVYLSRGYGRAGVDPVVWLPGETVPGYEALGDEPLMATGHIRNGAVGVAPDRAAALRMLEDRLDDALVLLDDGFQHHRLARDLDIVIVDERTAASPRVLPAGPLREPPTALQRAEIVVVTSPDAEAFAARYARPDALTVGMRQQQGGLTRFIDQTPTDPQSSRFLLVTGIARPERVERAVRAAGVELAGHLRFRDHHRYRPDDVRRMLQRMVRARATAIVTTEKDVVKLAAFAEIRDSLHVAGLRVELEREDEVAARVDALIGGRRPEPTQR